MKKIFAVIFIFAFTFINAFASDLGKIKVLNNGTLEIETKDFSLKSGEVSGDLKILKDYEVSFSSKDKTNQKVVKLNLIHDLEKNRNYTILGIQGAETDMSFSVEDKIPGEYTNSEKTGKGLEIEKINILDSKTVEIYYSQDLKEEEFAYKFLSENEVLSKTSDGQLLKVALKYPLEEKKSYIILSNFLENSAGEKQEMKEKIYEFVTEANLENIFGEEKKEKVTKDTGNLEELAQKAKTTPQTGAGVFIILFLALFLSFIFFIRKKA